MSAVKVALECLGCKLNQAELEHLGRQLVAAGYELVPSAAEADVYLLNTCTVTHIADRKSRHLLRMAHRQNPQARLVVTGCYAESDPQGLAGIEGVSLVLGNKAKEDIVRQLARVCPPSNGDEHSGYNGWRTRVFLKIQDGCRNFCSYCIVPLVRPEESSVPAETVIKEIKQRVAEGVKEVVLTGTEVGSCHGEGTDLKGLLEKVLSESTIARIRLSSLQPQEISDELVGLWQDARLCPHFHLSLQSGSDGVLRRMKRRYTTAGYANAVSVIRRVLPDAGITTDIIVGFPGESEAEFLESLSFCRKMQFARIHVFAYSARRGTAAAAMPGQVDAQTKKERSERMLALAEESARLFHEKFLGRTLPVLWEKQTGGVWSGYTGNYIKVYAQSENDLSNQIMPVKLQRVEKDGVGGES